MDVEARKSVLDAGGHELFQKGEEQIELLHLVLV